MPRDGAGSPLARATVKAKCECDAFANACQRIFLALVYKISATRQRINTCLLTATRPQRMKLLRFIAPAQSTGGVFKTFAFGRLLCADGLMASSTWLVSLPTLKGVGG